MRYLALAADYDGTLAHHGRIDDTTWAGLRKLRESGRKAIMVTGRELDELLALLASPDLFDRIVAENGAVLYTPSTREVNTLCEGTPHHFVDELKRRGVQKVSAGRVIVATWEPYQDLVLHAIRDLGLELQVIFNKGAVMVLPTGVNKATGLAAALGELGLSPHNVVAIGDAENDHALLSLCECGVAVANALPALKQHADLVTRGDHGAGVLEVIEQLIADDLARASSARRSIVIGRSGSRQIEFDPYGDTLLVCGTSGSGKSTLTTAILERLVAAHYQLAILDPEGDYSAFEHAVVLGSPHRAPLVHEVLDVLRDPARSVAVNLLGLAVEHRPEFYAQLAAALAELRARTGRPHWLVVDEAHHLLPVAWQPAAELVPRPRGTLYVTVHPESVAPQAIATCTAMLAIGERPGQRVRDFARLLGKPVPDVEDSDKLLPGEAVFWRVGSNHTTVIRSELPKAERTRHSRKYAEGNLGSERAFYFRGRDGKLNLKAHNLNLFLQLGDGVDDDTWMFHLRNGDYGKWLRGEVKDGELADEVAAIERANADDPLASRAAVRAAIERRYTLPADRPTGIVDRVE
jgi:HAD superfamily hydrolase (TIGR01484 family)